MLDAGMFAAVQELGQVDVEQWGKPYIFLVMVQHLTKLLP